MVEGRDVDWRQAAADAEAHPCVPVAATDQLAHPLHLGYDWPA